jgi:NAD(P)-dependent dehydrogenase (short-subunit alcohol dehydrogenase family)
MREFAGRTAFVTGDVSGIGLALGWAFAQAGMKVMPADIATDALAAGVKNLHAIGPDVCGVACDVADLAGVECAARASCELFGNVHVLGNNAGVGSGIDAIALDTWRWVLDVNLMVVVRGIRTAEVAQAGMESRRCRRQVLTANREDGFHVLTHPEQCVDVGERVAAILAAPDKAAARR